MDFANISELESEIDAIAKWDVIKGRPWINWNMRFLKQAPLSHAALAFQVLLPATYCITVISQESELKYCCEYYRELAR